MNLYNLLIADELGILSNDNLKNAIQDFVNVAKDGLDINDKEIQEAIFFYNDIQNLSDAEEKYLISEVQRKLYGI